MLEWMEQTMGKSWKIHWYRKPPDGYSKIAGSHSCVSILRPKTAPASHIVPMSSHSCTRCKFWLKCQPKVKERMLPGRFVRSTPQLGELETVARAIFFFTTRHQVQFDMDLWRWMRLGLRLAAPKPVWKLGVPPVPMCYQSWRDELETNAQICWGKENISPRSSGWSKSPRSIRLSLEELLPPSSDWTSFQRSKTWDSSAAPPLPMSRWSGTQRSAAPNMAATARPSSFGWNVLRRSNFEDWETLPLWLKNFWTIFRAEKTKVFSHPRFIQNIGWPYQVEFFSSTIEGLQENVLKQTFWRLALLVCPLGFPGALPTKVIWRLLRGTNLEKGEKKKRAVSELRCSL